MLNTDPIEFSFSASTFSVNENGISVAAVTVIRSGDTSAAASVTLTPSNGTATSPSDYNNSPIVVNFNPGQTSTTVTIPIIDDNIDEPNETINLTLSNPSTGVLLGTQTTAVLTIVDNDPVPKVSLSAATVSLNEGNIGTAPVTFTVSLSNPSYQVVTIPYTTNNGTAIAGSDYVDNDATLTFNSGETSKTITVLVNGDTTVEPNETFTVALGTPTNATLGTTFQRTATIVNDDGGSSGILAFSAPTFSVNENGTPVAAVTVTRTGGSTGSVSATITPNNGTATAPTDYTSNPVLVTFASGDTTAKKITIPIINDTVYERNETINLILSAPTGGATIGTQNSAVLTIVDNDPVPKVSLSPATLSLKEGNSVTTPFTFTVSLSNPRSQTITVPYRTNNGTATAGSDYVDNDATLTFNPGETSKTITVLVNGDSTVEPNETFTVALGTPTNATLGTTTQSTATIVNDDGTTIFDSTATPSQILTDGTKSVGDYELGMEFKSAKAGQIQAICYYKAPGETGTHIGRIWSSTGQLASVAFANETAFGWQVQILATPLNILANTTYVVSVNTNSYYAQTENGLVSPISNGDLTASKGVYNEAPGLLPSQSWNNSHYYRDIVFTSSADTIGPNAQLSAANFFGNGSTTYDFTVTYHDATSVNVGSLDSGDIQVSGPNGFNQTATLVGVNFTSNGTDRTATYRITAPGGTWDSADNGNYTIALQPNQVSDTLGNTTSTATTLGTFNFSTTSPVLPGLSNQPTPSSNPGLPTGADTFTPSFNGTVSAQSPIISEWTKNAQPGDTIVLTGWQFSRLTGSQFGNDTKFWVYGQTQSGNGVLAEAKIQSLSGDVVSITLPTNLPKGSDYMVWAQNSSGASKPVLINDTEAWWIGPNAATRGKVTSIFGRNLSQDGGTANTNVYLEDSAGKGYWSQVVGVNPYKVDFVVPPGLANGNYKVWVHNGDGGQYGWSKPLTMTINDGLNYTGKVFNVKDFGAKGDGVTNDAEAIQKAIWAADQVDGSTVYFPAGKYAVDAVNGWALNVSNLSNVRLLGDGKDLTTIKAADGSQEPYLFQGVNTNGVTFQALTLDANKQKATNLQFVTHIRNSSDLQYLNVRINAEGTHTFDWHANTGVLMKDSEVIGQSAFLGTAKQIFIDGTKFYGTDYTGILLQGFGVQQLSITNSTARNLDTSDVNNYKWGGGRFFADQAHWGVSQDQYIGNNETIDLAPPPVDFNHDGIIDIERNAGEQIMWEPPSASISLGKVTSSTDSSISVNSAVSVDTNVTKFYLSIVGGKGIGQNRQVTSFDSVTGKYNIEGKWNVLPDQSSIIVANQIPSRVVVYGNTLDGTTEAYQSPTHVASAGVQTFHGATDLIIDRNTFHELRAGVSLWTGWDATDNKPVSFAQISNNKFIDDLTGVVFPKIAGEQGTAVLGSSIRNNSFNNVNTVFSMSINDGVTGTNPLPNANFNVFENNTLGTGGTSVSIDQGGGNIQNNIFLNNNLLQGDLRDLNIGVTSGNLFI